MHEVAGDLAGRRALAEDPVDAELGGLVSSNRGPPTTSSGRRAGRVRLAEGSRHLAGVVQVGVALGDDLGDEDGVGLLRAGPRDELGDEHLRAEVHDLDLAVVLQALLAREALDVEDRVDADGVRVGADAGADAPPAGGAAVA